MVIILSIFYILAIGLFKKHISFVSWNRLIFYFLLILTYILYFWINPYNDIWLFSILFISRSYSFQSIVLIKSYNNADSMKLKIFEENKNKSGIYRWVNKENGKSYIGSSVNLTRRFYQYYNSKYLLSTNMIICQALLKYGYSTFSLEILEYCEVKDVISREQYYLNLLQPEYNILENAGNLLGYKHSEESKKKISNSNSGKIHSEETKLKISNIFRGKILSEETKLKISNALSGDNNPFFGKIHSEETKFKISKSKGTTIYLYSLDLELLEIFISSQKAGEYFNCHKTTARRACSKRYETQV